MVEIKRILYPIDFSECSYQVLPYVLYVAEKYHADIYLVYVVDDLRHFAGMHVPHTSISDFVKEAMVESEKMLDKICDEHLQSCPNFQRRLVMGDPRIEILKMVESEKIDLVIMGSHSRRGLERVIFGSVAEYVVRHSPMPVLVVNPHRFKERQ
ncbi:MAG: universal stress protein [Syntrophobacterales bacterium]